jgi:acyl-coenzyme A synthetase/AMP-(fatty) acid ligase
VTRAAREETIRIANFLKASGDRYNRHFRGMIASAVLLFAVAAAGWVTTHPFALTAIGAVSTVLIFIGLGHRRHESEYYYRVASAMLSPLQQQNA